MRRSTMLIALLLLLHGCSDDGQPAGDAGGDGSDATVAGTFACGDELQCAKATQYCQAVTGGACYPVDGGGCVGSVSYSCLELPDGCSGCACITSAECSCSGSSQAGFTLSCAAP